MNEVIDKIAEQLGIAIKDATPLAEEIVRQYSLGSLAGAVMNIFCLICVLVVAFKFITWLRGYEESADGCKEFCRFLIFGVMAAAGLALFILFLQMVLIWVTCLEFWM